MKTCGKCKAEKPLSDFTKDKRRQDGLNGLCRLCSRKQVRVSYSKHKQKYHDRYHKGGLKEMYAILYRQNARRCQMRSRVSRLRRRGKKHGVVEMFTIMDFEQVFARFDNKCFNCGTQDRDLQVDHHVPQHLGVPLTYQNAVILCDKCNATKGTQNPEDFYTAEQLDRLKVLFAQ